MGIRAPRNINRQQEGGEHKGEAGGRAARSRRLPGSARRNPPGSFPGGTLSPGTLLDSSPGYGRGVSPHIRSVPPSVEGCPLPRKSPWELEIRGGTREDI